MQLRAGELSSVATDVVEAALAQRWCDTWTELHADASQRATRQADAAVQIDALATKVSEMWTKQESEKLEVNLVSMDSRVKTLENVSTYGNNRVPFTQVWLTQRLCSEGVDSDPEATSTRLDNLLDREGQ